MAKTIKKEKPPKLCKHCKEPLENRQWTYHTHCKIELAKERAFKKRLETDEIKKLKKEAWDIFSKYIRIKYSDKNGMGKCVTCRTPKLTPWKKLQAGHGISGRGGYVLFNEKIVRPQCFHCNCNMGGRPDDFMYYLVDIEKTLTADEYMEIKRQSMIPHKLHKSDYEHVIEHYGNLIKEIQNV